jgi:hypothetical protein
MPATLARTDIHRPSASEFDPQAYRIVGVYDCQDPISNLEKSQVLAGSLSGYALGNGSDCNCGHCGARIRYSALLARDDVREYIHVGEVCLDNRFQQLTAAEFQRLREQARLNRERANLEERIDSLIEQHPVLQRLLNGEGQSSFLVDVRRRFVESGRLSERQIAAIQRAFDGEDRRARWEAEKQARAAELKAAGVEAPTGRVQVEGKIISSKTHGSWIGRRYVESLKVTILHDTGWKCWVTLPDSLRVEEPVGRRVRLTATLVQSDRDAAFAFGKRPTNAEYVR